MTLPDRTSVEHAAAAIGHKRSMLVLGFAIFLTTAAEIFYLVVWGMLLFPEGSLAGKTVWTLTCGLAMGSVIGAGTLLIAEPQKDISRNAFWLSSIIFAAVGSYCSWLCSVIDAHLRFFGGPVHSTLFILSGIGPAIVGGLLYGWVLYLRDRRSNTQSEKEQPS